MMSSSGLEADNESAASRPWASQAATRASDLALVIDASGVVEELTVGPAMESAERWSSLVGRRWVDVLTKETRPKVEPLLSEARAQGSSARARELNLLVDGLGEVPLRFNTVRLDERRVVALGVDLRGLWRAQQQLVRTQQDLGAEFERLRTLDTRYRLLFHVANEGVLVVDLEQRRVAMANPTAASLLQQPASALTGAALDDLFQGLSRESVEGLLKALERGERPDPLTLRLGGLRTELTLKGALFRQQGSSLALLRFHRSVWPGEGLRTERLWTVLEAMPDGLVVFDPGHTILSANRAFTALVEEPLVLGNSIDRWLGRTSAELDRLLSSIVSQGTVRGASLTVRLPAGRTVEMVATGVAALDGKVPCLGLTLRPALAHSLAPDNLPRSLEQVRSMVGRLPLRDIVRESADLIEKLCIEAAMGLALDRAGTAALLGLTPDELAKRLQRYGL